MPAVADDPVDGLWRDRPVLVTGGTGFVGSHLCAQLVGAGALVSVLRRDVEPVTSVQRPWVQSVRWVEGDITDQALLERALGEHEIATVFHLAAQTQVGVANRNPVSTFESNIAGTWALLEAVRRSPRVEQVVVASSDKAYGDQPTLPYTEDMPLLAVHPYDVSKASADLLAASYHRTWGVPVAVTRCGNFFGPGDTSWSRVVPGTIRSLLRGDRPVVRSDGSLVRDYLYVEDGAHAYRCVAEAMARRDDVAGEAFNFSTESPLTVLELIERIQMAMGTDLAPDVRDEATSEIQAQHLCAAKARELLGWQPRWSLDDALAATVDWYRSELGC